MYGPVLAPSNTKSVDTCTKLQPEVVRGERKVHGGGRVYEERAVAVVLRALDVGVGRGVQQHAPLVRSESRSELGDSRSDGVLVGDVEL